MENPEEKFIQKPGQPIKREFYGNPDIVTRKPRPGGKDKRRVQTKRTQWPTGRLDYEFMEKCKQVICRIPHPNKAQAHRGAEFRLSRMPWSRSEYIDIRTYVNGKPTGRGILLHFDIAKALLPELITLVQTLDVEETREPQDIQPVKLILG